jgi:aminoglycoside phosphotransferase (APT) family kinase protein
MRDRPTGLDERELLSALLEGWALHAESSEYLPVGAGSYHWSVIDRNSIVWFVKVDDLSAGGALSQDVFNDLRRSLTTALTLHRDVKLDFVVAPIPARDGAVLRRLAPSYALSVYPMVDGTAGNFGPHRCEDLVEVVALLADLHRATPAVAHLVPQTGLRLPRRERLHEALRDLDLPWSGGPHAEPARKLLVRHQARILRWLADFDGLVDIMRETTPNWVVTHGEPHPGNIMRTSHGLRLIDWTTVRLASPERDLWMLTTAFTSMIGADPAGVDDEMLARYAEATGRSIAPAGIALYRRWWALADVAAFVDDLRRPHGDGEDAAAALTYLTGYLETVTD